MKVQRRDGSPERKLLIGMVTQRAVVAAVAAVWDGRQFGSRWSNLVGGWAVEHFRRYGKPPGRQVEGYFDDWAARAKDQDTVKLIEQFLDGLSRESQRAKPSSAYLLDLADRHLSLESVKRLAEELEGDARSLDPAKALERIQKFRPPRVGASAGVRLLDDREAVRAAFESRGEVLIRWGQEALDNFFEETLARGEFIAFMGKEKVGKSFWLQELAWLASLQGRNAAFFEVGDQSQNQLIRRFGARAAGRPFKRDRVVRFPTVLDPGEPPHVEYDERRYEEPMTWQEAFRALRKAGREHGADRLRLSVHPNSSISVLGIEAILDGWARDGWVPDVVGVDYADILAPINGKDDSRDQINASWKALRRLNQKLDCLMLTGTQADAGSYEVRTLTRRNFSEDKRKYSHVTGTVGINQTDAEKEAGLYRLNWIVGRDLEFSEEQCVTTAACLPYANPAVRSTF